MKAARAVLGNESKKAAKSAAPKSRIAPCITVENFVDKMAPPNGRAEKLTAGLTSPANKI